MFGEGAAAACRAGASREPPTGATVGVAWRAVQVVGSSATAVELATNVHRPHGTSNTEHVRLCRVGLCRAELCGICLNFSPRRGRLAHRSSDPSRPRSTPAPYFSQILSPAVRDWWQPAYRRYAPDHLALLCPAYIEKTEPATTVHGTSQPARGAVHVAVVPAPHEPSRRAGAGHAASCTARRARAL